MRNRFLTSLVFCASLAPFAIAAEAPKITDVRAQLFYDGKGTLSDNILAQKDLTLWNTIIGEGSAGGASNSTLITVEVSGKDVAVGGVKVEVVATGHKNKVLGKTVMDVALYDDKTRFYAPLMLTNTGCDPVKVTVRLVGKGAPKGRVAKTIPFQCGE